MIANKVYIQPISERDQIDGIMGNLLNEDNQKHNVKIRVKNSDTLDEYSGTAFLNPQYMDKVQRWVKKNKYQCLSLNNDMELELRVEIFKFHLSKAPKSDMDTMKQNLAEMRKDNARLKGQLKLFRYYFLQIWREKNRHMIDNKTEFRQELVESTSNLFDEVQA